MTSFAAAPRSAARRIPATEQFLLDIIDTIPESLLVLDPEFRIVKANRAFFRLFRVAPTETIGRNLFTLGDGQWDIAPLRELLLDKLAVEPRRDDVEVDHVFPDIGRRIMLVNARVVARRTKVPRVILLTIEDVTERHFASLRMAAHQAELQRSNAALDEFASVTSHDLQEPLRKLLSFGERLAVATGPAISGDARKSLELMLDAAARMRTLTDDLLTYSRVTMRAHRFVPTNLATVAREVVSDLETAVADENGLVEIGDLPVIDADPLQMRQLLQNLIGNSLKYRRSDAAPVVRVGSSRAHADHWSITVADNGIGFYDRYAERIFRMFERLHGRREYKGSGIGLAICKKIVERHNGTISAKSLVGHGSTFTVVLPAKHSVPRPGQ
jgi:PAS domain S-box-containing protein